MSDGLSLREFGRQLDVTGEAVRKAIAEGKIPADCVGERIVGKGKSWPIIIDPDRAAAHWNRSRDPNQVRDKAVMSAGAKKGWAQRRGEEPPPDDEDDEDLDDARPGELRSRLNGGAAGAGSGKSEPSIADYRRITEAYKAKTAKLEFEERVGLLVNADQIKAFHVGLMTALRNRIMGVPSEAKSRIPHLTVDEVDILEELIAKALEDVADDDDE